MNENVSAKHHQRKVYIIIISVLFFCAIALLVIFKVIEEKEFGDISYGYYGAVYPLIPLLLTGILAYIYRYRNDETDEMWSRLFDLITALVCSSYIITISFISQSFPKFINFTSDSAVIIGGITLGYGFFLMFPHFRSELYEKAIPMALDIIMLIAYFSFVFVNQMMETNYLSSIISIILFAIEIASLIYLLPPVRTKVRLLIKSKD